MTDQIYAVNATHPLVECKRFINASFSFLNNFNKSFLRVVFEVNYALGLCTTLIYRCQLG